MKKILTALILTILLITACASQESRSDSEIIQQVKEKILSESYDPSIRLTASESDPVESVVAGSSFKEDTLVFLAGQGYSQAEALDILNLATISAVSHMILYENKSNQAVERYLLVRGYSPQEIEAVMGEANRQLIEEALIRDLSLEDITKGFVERGFTTEEIQTIQRMVVVEKVKKALSEDTPPVEIVSELEKRGFTQKEIEEIMEDAGYQQEKNPGAIPLFPIFLSVFLLVAAALIWTKKTAKRRCTGGINLDLELTKLLDEKNRIEEMIELAKTKYHTRALDEESFREIIRDHQKRLIEVEAKIKHLDSRIQKLEEKS